ncbi:MAG: efflux RND transporter permease subunit [Myxococcaceae bacterium]
MKITEFSVKNRAFTLVLLAMMIALGAAALKNIPRAEDPVVPFPVFGVYAVYPGASPSQMEQLVVEPLEKAVKPLDGLKKLQSSMTDGFAFVRIEFNTEEDVDRKYDEVVREVNAARASLPADLQKLETKKFSANNVAILQVALVAPALKYEALEKLGDDLVKQYEAVTGVRDATLWAYPDQEARVSLDPARMLAAHLTLGQVMQAVQLANLDIPGGSLDLGARRFNVKTAGDLGSIEALSDVVVQASPQGLVRLKDVAAIELRDRDAAHLARYDGERAVFVTVTMKDKQNIFTVHDQLAQVSGSFGKTLPAGVRLETGFDQSQNVSHRLNGFVRDFILAIALVLLTLLPLGLRASGVVMLSIPLSLALGLAALDVFGFTINQLSIVGFVIALGLLVDDSIVVVENVSRHLRMGKTPLQAARDGAAQIGIAVLGCTATLVLAFVPVIFLPGTPGRFIRGMPMAVVFTVLASLLVSFTVVPLISSMFLKPEHDPEGNFFMKALHKGIEGTYRRVLQKAISFPKVTVAAAAMLFVATLGLVPVVGFSLFPKAGMRQFIVDVETPEGTSLDQTDRALSQVEAKLRSHSEVETVMTNLGRGNPTVYYNVAQAPERANFGELVVQLHHYDEQKSPVLIDQLRAELAQVPGARVTVLEFSNGPQIDAPIAIRLIGTDLDALEQAGAQVEQLLKNTPGTRDVKNPSSEKRTDLKVAVDRSRAGLYGVPVAEVNRTVRMGLAGVKAGSLKLSNGDELDIQLRLPAEPHPTLAGFQDLQVSTFNGAQVPLSQVSELELSKGPTSINHFNRERVVTITSQVETGYVTDRVTRTALATLSTQKLPDGVRYVPAGEIESRQESFGGLSVAAIIAAFGVLAVLVLEFGTFKSTAIVASVIPLGLVGGILALFFSGNTLSFTAAIGFIALVGIEVKNSILLVDFTNQLRAKGVPLDEAIEQAGETRFVPILLTTATALGGLVPLAMEHSPLYSPLALVIIGGLLSSTLLTRLVTPVMYKLLAPEVKVEHGLQGTA